MGAHVFISYSHRDDEYVERLKRHLVEAGLSVWTDSGIDYGGQWPGPHLSCVRAGSTYGVQHQAHPVQR